MRRRSYLTVILVVLLASTTAADARAAIDPPAPAGDTIRPRFDGFVAASRTIYPHRLLRRPKVGLVLTGGGARGVAQIGVLKALERHGIPINFIAATSMGGIVGGLYAAGYSADELEGFALTTNWDDLLSLTGETKRTELFVEQKIAGDRNFLAVRFQGFEPVLPSAVSSGQRLTDFLSTKTLQALYHAYPDFDHLKIPFRAVATDLVSGREVVLRNGSLAEALRASATVPLLFNPIEKDSMQLVDGGLVDNVPSDIARNAGCDLVIAVNTTSGLRDASELKAPWETADQIMGIMMERVNSLMFTRADVVITPDIGRHLSTDFGGLDSLIADGERAADSLAGTIDSVYRVKARALQAPVDSLGVPAASAGFVAAGALRDSVWDVVSDSTSLGSSGRGEVRERLDELYETGEYRDVSAVIFRDSAGVRVRFTTVPNPVLRSVEFEGCRIIGEDTLRSVFTEMMGRSINTVAGEKALENALRIYRGYGYSLARIDSTVFDERTGSLRVLVSEGIIRDIRIVGGVRTEDSFVRREFPLHEGDVFQIDRARQGITNIHSTTLFEYVYLEVSDPEGGPLLTIRLKERPSQLVRLGLHADNEREVQGSLDIRDENFHGTGTELGFTIDGGSRNGNAVLEYRAHRLFDTYLTFRLHGFYHVRNSYLYADAPHPGLNQWDRIRIGEYQDSRYGAGLTFGSQLERLGNATVEFILQNTRVRSMANAQDLEERHRLALIRAGTVVDTKDSYPFPTSGIGLNLSYEFAVQEIGSDVSYNALTIQYESFSTVGDRLTFHPRLTIGVADNTMPFSQQYRFGGLQSFLGLHEDDRLGRQMLLVNLEYRYRLPIDFLFDTYLMARYDIGTISALPEDIKLSALQHGVGGMLAFRTPVGPAIFGLGKSFYLSRSLPNNPVQQGPLLFYFMIGYQL